MSPAVRVHHIVEGPPDAPVLVLSNSLGTTLSMWDPQVEALARSFRVVRFDLRGHGDSPVPAGPYEIADLGADLIRLLDDLDVARAHLCGLSLGGMLSMWVAAHAPERVDRLVLCSTSAQLGPPEVWANRAAKVLAEGTSSIADLLVSRWFTPAFVAREPGVVARLRAGLAGLSAVGYAACCGAIERMNLLDDLALIGAPTLALAGADDPAIPLEHSYRIAEGIAGCRVVLVAKASHLANLEQPAEVTARIMEHLRGPSPEDDR